jgi:glycosyltransferase involved in cell wall biosynthesis
MRAARVLERGVVRRANKVVFVSDANRNENAAYYGGATALKFEVVPNGCDVTEFDGISRHTDGTGVFTLLHAGSLYAGRTPDPVLRAVAEGIRQGFIDPARFRLRFMGAVALHGDLASTLDELKLQRVVEFMPRVPRRESLQAMVDASALLLLQPGHDVAVPAKLYEYLAARRPILAICSGETAEVVSRSGIALCARADDGSAVLQALLGVIRMAEQPLHPAPLQVYDGRVRARQLASLITDAAISSGRSVDGTPNVRIAGNKPGAVESRRASETSR